MAIYSDAKIRKECYFCNMIKLSTTVKIDPLPVKISLSDTIMVVGSCFADSVGQRLAQSGFNVCINPFGTLYNPVSIANSLARLSHPRPFSEEECVEMGAGAGLICSWWHHTSFARSSCKEFLEVANASLQRASEFWKKRKKVIVTLGTAMVWRRVSDGEIVSNCLKRPSREFSHEILSVGNVAAILKNVITSYPDKEFIFTVSPIRHLGEGAHNNSISKATLLLGLDSALQGTGACYYPSYEILLDELRDYRYYTEDLVHPSKTAVDIIYERFLDAVTVEEERKKIERNEKEFRFLSHREMH